MFKNWKIVLLISMLTLVNCKSPTSPEPIDPWKYGGEIEIMYVRVKEVVYPNNPDPTGGASIYHYKIGGKNSSYGVAAGENTWIYSVYLDCDPQPYTISTGDSKISLYPVGEKFFLRLKKEGASWVELTCIVPHPSRPNGQASKFIFDNGQISNVNPCS